MPTYLRWNAIWSTGFAIFHLAQCELKLNPCWDFLDWEPAVRWRETSKVLSPLRVQLFHANSFTSFNGCKMFHPSVDRILSSVTKLSLLVSDSWQWGHALPELAAWPNEGFQHMLDLTGRCFCGKLFQLLMQLFKLRLSKTLGKLFGNFDKLDKQFQHGTTQRGAEVERQC